MSGAIKPMRRRLISALGALAVACSAAILQPVALADTRALDLLHKRLQGGEVPNVHSVLVVQHGRTVAEWYFDGTDEIRGGASMRATFDHDTLHDLRSASKSVVSLLFGIALKSGAIKDLDTPVLDYFPEYSDLQTPERRKIRLRDLLTMTSGLRWDEGPSYKDPRNSETAMDAAPDRYRYVLSRPLDSLPGTRWRYSGGDVALVAAVITRTTGIPIDEYAKKLFLPLKISDFVWLKDAKEVPFAASGLRLTPRDMAKIGLMVLRQGRSATGVQVVPGEWIKASIAPHVKAFQSGNCTVEYGYFWWLGPRCNPKWVSAIGNGGQRIYLVPSRDLVIVTTAGLYNSPQRNKMNDVLTSIEDAVQ
jgi:CubicO group peptidase (beta-lactamase class C family)